jgi:transposase
MTVIIGVDPHKATHTAVAIDGDEQPLARFDLVADRSQTQRLLAWAAPFAERRWAVESADGLGKLLAQQLLAAGEDVLEVPPTLSARVRLLGSTKAAKNDSNDALSTAIAGLRHCGLRAVRVDDHTSVIRMLVDRYDDLTRLRTQAACRLHATLRDLVAGGAPRRLSADRAAKLVRSVRPVGVAEIERKRLAGELLADLRRLDREIAAGRGRVADAVTKSGTALLELHGVGPVVAGFILGHVGDPARFPTRARFAAYDGTAPIEASSGPRSRHRLNPRGNRKLNHAPAHGGGHPDRPRHPGPGLLPAQDRRGEVEEGGAARPETSHQRRRLAPAPSRPRSPLTTGPGGQPGTTLQSSVAG